MIDIIKIKNKFILFKDKIINSSFKKKLISFFVILHIIFFGIFVNLSNLYPIIKYSIFISMLVLPFLILILIVLDNVYFDKLMKYIWFKSLVYLISTIFIIYANSYASTEINNIFEVSSSYLPITTIVLTHLYVLDIISGLIGIFLIFLSLAIGISIVYGLVYQNSLKKNIVPLLLLGVYLVIVKTPNDFIILNKEKIIKEIAYEFDFNKKYYCKKFENVDSVLFLSSTVIVKYIKPQNGKEFEVKECVIK